MDIHDSTKESVTGALKTASKKVNQETTEATGDLVGNKIAEKIAKAASNTTCEDQSKLPVLIDDTITKSIEIPKEKYISPER